MNRPRSGFNRDKGWASVVPPEPEPRPEGRTVGQPRAAEAESARIADAVAGFRDIESIASPAAELSDHERAAIEAITSGRRPTAQQGAALRRLLSRSRPALRVSRGKVQPWPYSAAWMGAGWNQIDATAKPALAATGLLEVDQTAVATGFLVARNLIATNNHVVDRVGPINGLRDVTIRFAVESEKRSGARLAVVAVVSQHPEFDLALLRLEKPARRRPLPLSAGMPTTQQRVVAIGYPFPDSDRVPAFMEEIFGDNYKHQAVSPGAVRAVTRKDRIEHDCSTLGGSSGSPLIDLARGVVVGVQSEGRYLMHNIAEPASAVAEMLESTS